MTATQRRVLLVSADLNQAKATTAAFKGMPLVLSKTLDDANSALRYSRVYPPDILLLDDSMVGMPPSEFMNNWRASLNLRRIPTVMTVAKAAHDTLIEAVSLGCVGFLAKPFAPTSLRKHLAQAISLVEETEGEKSQVSNASEMMANGKYDDAIHEFEAAVELTDESEVHFQAGIQHLGRGEYAEAVGCFMRAVRLNGFFAEAYEGLSKCFAAKGDGVKARQYLKRAAQVHAEFNRREEARKCFVQVLAEEPDAENPYFLLGKRLLRQGDYKSALGAMESALELSPDSPEIIQNLARLHHIFGHRNQAMQLLQNLLAYGGKFPEATKLLKHIQETSWATIDAG